MNVELALRAVREQRSIRQRQRYQKSKLYPYQSILRTMREADATLGDLQFWLEKTKHITVARSTIKRFLDRNPEIENGPIC